ncbi:carbamoyltransferase N-terminal domain-containing protein [Micromonospora sp. BRA006-A]|nr:carbamoyltransferase N-terminal domain-containing protein [Micromonospora sp. BRA006-A]
MWLLDGARPHPLDVAGYEDPVTDAARPGRAARPAAAAVRPGRFRQLHPRHRAPVRQLQHQPVRAARRAGARPGLGRRDAALLYLVEPDGPRVRGVGRVNEFIGGLYPIFASHFDPFRVDRRNADPDRRFGMEALLPVSGKAMAYAGLGKPVEAVIDVMGTVTAQFGAVDTPMRSFQWSQRVLQLARGLGATDAELLASFQEYLFRALVTGMVAMLDRHPELRALPLCLSGGCALNIKWNSGLRSAGTSAGVGAAVPQRRRLGDRRRVRRDGPHDRAYRPAVERVRRAGAALGRRGAAGLDVAAVPGRGPGRAAARARRGGRRAHRAGRAGPARARAPPSSRPPPAGTCSSGSSEIRAGSGTGRWRRSAWRSGRRRCSRPAPATRTCSSTTTSGPAGWNASRLWCTSTAAPGCRPSTPATGWSTTCCAPTSASAAYRCSATPVRTCRDAVSSPTRAPPCPGAAPGTCGPTTCSTSASEPASGGCPRSSSRTLPGALGAGLRCPRADSE